MDNPVIWAVVIIGSLLAFFAYRYISRRTRIAPRGGNLGISAGPGNGRGVRRATPAPVDAPEAARPSGRRRSGSHRTSPPAARPTPRPRTARNGEDERPDVVPMDLDAITRPASDPASERPATWGGHQHTDHSGPATSAPDTGSAPTTGSD